MILILNVSQGLRRISVVAIAATIALGSPSIGFAGSNAENAARNTMGAIYGGAAKRMCGKKCGVVGRQAGKRVFDGAQWITNKTRDAGLYGGQKIRKRYCRNRKCN
jgi:hypothetical protein